MTEVNILNHTQPLKPPLRAGLCDTFLTRLRGFMFQRGVPQNGGLLFEGSESRMDAAIHMFFVGFDLGVVWINRKGEVVDTVLAKAWRPFYMPARPASYVLEIHPSRLGDFHKGDRVTFEKGE